MKTTVESDWPPAPSEIVLGREEVHVFRARLDLDATELEKLALTLSAEEWERARRFRFSRDRDRFTAARGVLRLILTRYLSGDPARLRFAYAPFGKPSLDSGGELRFNVAHSDEWALFAVTRGREVGVDVERIRPDFATEEIAERFYSGMEVAALRALPPRERAVGFFVCWTRKEAYLKARGEGLSVPLASFSVSLDESRLEMPGLPGWFVRSVHPGSSYVGAVAVEGRDFCIRRWEWSH